MKANKYFNTLLLLVLFVATTFCNAQTLPNCTELKQNLSTFGRSPRDARIQCADLCTGESISDPFQCNSTNYCVFLNGNCYLKERSNALASVQGIDLDSIGQRYFRRANGTSRTGPRRLPGSSIPFTLEQIQDIFPGVSICQEFPDSCTISYTSPSDIQPQLNIPYCQRIVCRQDNPSLEFDATQCLSTPGCAFDYSLYLYRSVLGSAVLFNIPICHLAIRNDVFHRRANEYITKGNAWNPILTNCLVEENREEIFRESRECARVGVLEDLGYRAKGAGWRGISSRDCHLINGCWINNACVYPLHLTKTKVKAESKQTPSFISTVAYGRTKCLPFGNDLVNGDFLDAYHTCLQSGCAAEIDRETLTQHLMGVARTYLPPPLQFGFQNLVSRGLVQAHNWKSMADQLTQSSVFFPRNPPETSPPRPGNNNFPPGVGGPFPPGVGGPFSPGFGGPFPPGVGGPFPPGVGGPFSDSDQEGFLTVPTFRFTPPCPYINIQWPGFPSLQGSFEGCCEKSLCYVPRNKVRNARSEISSYLTEWSTWTSCSKTCGNAQQTRRQECVGDDCGNAREETRECDLEECLTYSQWSEYGSCSASCGGGSITRTRTCSSSNLSVCNESLSESMPCRTGRCPSIRIRRWSRCSTTCGVGMQRRSITCDRPGDYGCPETRIEMRQCETFCGGIRYVDSKCNLNTCLITRTPQCVLRNGRPGHCKKRPRVTRVLTKKCLSGPCFCVHNPRRRRCRTNRRN